MKVQWQVAGRNRSVIHEFGESATVGVAPLVAA